MMYPNRSDRSHRRKYSERSSRHWDDYDDQREERHESYRDVLQESYHRYGRDEQRNSERRSRGREYSDSPKGQYSKDSLNKDWSTKSPVRRPKSSSDWAPSEAKRRRFTERDEDDYRCRRETEDVSHRLSQTHRKDFKHSKSQEEDLKYRKTSEDPRHKYQHEDFSYRQQQNYLISGQSSGYHKDRDCKDPSQERRPSQDCSSRSYTKPRERKDNPIVDHEDRHHDRAMFSLSSSGLQSLESDVSFQIAAAPEQKIQAKGFQRFLDVLNRGVNVDMLTKILSQNSEGVDDQPKSPTSFMDPADRSWSPSFTHGQQDSNSICLWNDSKGVQRLDSPHRRPFSPVTNYPLDDTFIRRADGEGSCLRSGSRSRSPSLVEKKSVTPEDEHKHRQIQDVLQAIGLNLGFEELGQMSHRIQERLYGKKDCDRDCHSRESRERDKRRRAYSPRLQSRSSSSRSSFSPPVQEFNKYTDADSAQRDVTEIQHIRTLQSVEYIGDCITNTLEDTEELERNSEEKTNAGERYPQNNMYSLSKPSPPPVMSVYSPVNCSPLTYTALPPTHTPAMPTNVPPPCGPALPPTLTPAMPTNVPPPRAPTLPPTLHPAHAPAPSPALPPALPPNMPPTCLPTLSLAPPPALPPTFPPALPRALPSFLPNIGPRFLFPPRPPLLHLPGIRPLNIFPGVLPQTRHIFPQPISNFQPPLVNLPLINPIQPVNNTKNKKNRPRCLQVIETKQPG